MTQSSTLQAAPPFDILITGGRVVDGSGLPWYRADVGIRGDRIAAVGQLTGAAAALRLDAAGKVVAPGFIDAHVHGDLPLLMDPLHEPAIRQGVTTYLLGQDGVAMAPGSPSTVEYMCRYTAGFSGGGDWLARPDRPTWSSMAEYLDRLDRCSAVNVACLVPNGNVRLDALGLETRPPTPDELAVMRRLTRQAMEEGAVGLSSGLDYIPSRYAMTEELAALCEEIAPFGGVYVTHMRRYDPDGVCGSLEEVFAIGRQAGVGVHVSHFNSRADIVLPILDRARANGVDVTFDLYCYLAGSSILGMYALPPWIQEGGIDATLTRLRDPGQRAALNEWFASERQPLNAVRLSYFANPEWKKYEGQTLPQAAGATDPARMGEFVREALLASEMAVGCVVAHRRRGEEDVRALMRHPAMMAGSDCIFTGAYPHPRGCGCFARYLGHYVRERVWTLEEAVQHLAAHAARRFGLRDRGLLYPGMAADVVVFDAERVADRSTYDDGRQLAEGMAHVLVNGEVVLQNGARTPALPGRALRPR